MTHLCKEADYEISLWFSLHEFFQNRTDFNCVIFTTEYTEMVRNLQDAFQEAMDRYLESDPSSDEEVAVEFPPIFEEQKGKGEPFRKKRKLKRKGSDQIKDKENKKKKYDSEDSDSKPPSLKPQRIR